MQLYVLYYHINSVKQEVFYVGIGKLKRAYSKQSRSIHWNSITNKYDYEVIIIHKDLTWEEACKLEKKYIEQIGRHDLGLGTLVNHTNGGDGVQGFKPTNPSWNKGLTRETNEQVNRVAKLKEGKHLSQETKDKKSKALLGRKHTKEHKAKQLAKLVERHSKTSKEEKSLIAQKVWETRRQNGTNVQTQEQKEAKSKRMKGRKLSEETKQRMKLAKIKKNEKE